jgi:hypothetical protein
VCLEGLCQLKIPMTIGNRTRDHPQYVTSVKSINRDNNMYSCDITTHLFLAVCIVFNK